MDFSDIVALGDQVRVLAFSGPEEAGKSTACRLMKARHPGAVVLSFAAPLKDGVMAMYGFTREQVYGTLKDVVDPRYGCTPRYVLQRVGTEFFRNLHATMLPECDLGGVTLWIKRMVDQIKALPAGSIVMIDDLRFPDELQALRTLGATVVKVTRPGAGGGDRAVHPSAQQWQRMDADLDIVNDGTLKALGMALLEVVPQ